MADNRVTSAGDDRVTSSGELRDLPLVHIRCSHLITAEAFKLFFNLALEIPDAFLERQIIAACLKLYRDTGINEGEYPETLEEWYEAQYYSVYSNSLSYLNTFTLQGSARAERLGGAAVDSRFLEPDEVKKLQLELNNKYKGLIKHLSIFEIEDFEWAAI